MRINRTLLLLVSLAGCAAEAPATEPVALLSDECAMGGDPDVAWFAPGDTVDVWISIRPGLSALDATEMPQDLLANAVRQALNVWNEESGAALRLYFRGFTDHARIDGALVIAGRTDVCDGDRAVALPDVDPSNNHLRSTGIELRWGTRSDPSHPCGQQHFVASPDGGTDVVAVLIHEIGHAVFNLDEVQPVPFDPSCVDFDQATVMRASGSRVLSSWDQEMAQRRVGARGRDGRFHWTEMSGPTSWFPVSAADGMDGIQPLFRPGSMSAGMPEPWFGWIQARDGDVQRGGTGRADVNRWRFGGGSDDWTLHTAPDGALGRPVAVASSTATRELLLAYQIAADGDDIYRTREGQLCWRFSQDEGASWSPPTCEWPGDFGPKRARVGGYGLTATYDARTDVFLIGYVFNPDKRDDFQVNVLTVPASSNSTTPIAASHLGISSVHAPGLACRGDTGTCLAAVQQDNEWGTLATRTFEIDAGAGLAVALGPLESSLIPIYDTPSVVYIAADDTYRVAHAVDSAAIYSHKKPAGGGAWAGTGDIFNDTSANVSSPILTVVPDAEGRSFAHAWFVRYW